MNPFTKAIALWLVLSSTAVCAQAKSVIPTTLTGQSAGCIGCHREQTPGVYQEWGVSKHYRSNVGCFECHGAEAGEPDAMEHNGYTIAVIVSPKDCSRCHEKETREFQASHHSDAGKIIGSLDNVLAEVCEGNLTFMGASAAAVNGCWQCHGSAVKVEPGGKLSPTTWPNTGMGRLNPDGSKGSCSACHMRHAFSAAQARRPETCGKCHLGPDHPQKEIYEESKHGINFFSNVERMNLFSSKWVVGEDYFAAPTCATCHMSATRELPVTHDVGARISWTNRPAVSAKVDAAAFSAGKAVKRWEDRRKDMKDVCSACHAAPFVENFYTQYDALVNLYNEKFARPGVRIMKSLKEGELISSSTEFDDKIEWTWFLLWHHQGRRARHGASMFAPDYTQWHGMFDVAEIFYTEFIPEVRSILQHAKELGKARAAADTEKILQEILDSPDHAWFTGKMSESEKTKRRKAQEEFNKRYLPE